MSEIDETMNSLVKSLIDRRKERYAFEGHPLAKHSDFIRNKYLQILCCAILYKSSASEAQQLFFARIVSGAEAEHSEDKYFSMAFSVDEKALDDLIGGVKRDPILRCAFLIDLMILCNLNKCTDAQASFITELVDAIGVEGRDLEFITTFARAVLTLDGKVLEEAQKYRPAAISKNVFYCYILLFSKEAISAVLGTTKEEWNRIAGGGEANAVIQYVTLDKNNSDGYDLEFVGGEGTIMFRHCKFSFENKMEINNLKKVVFEDCEFEDFSSPAVRFYQVTDALFIRCKFNDCVCDYSYSSDSGEKWHKLGGVIKKRRLSFFAFPMAKAKMSKILLSQCEFTNCGGRNEHDYYASSIIADGQMTIHDCTFVNCWNYHNNDVIDPEHENRVLFDNVTEATGNKLINSAALCPGAVGGTYKRT